jgi:hypothetical protein
MAEAAAAPLAMQALWVALDSSVFPKGVARAVGVEGGPGTLGGTAGELTPCLLRAGGMRHLEERLAEYRRVADRVEPAGLRQELQGGHRAREGPRHKDRDKAKEKGSADAVQDTLEEMEEEVVSRSAALQEPPAALDTGAAPGTIKTIQTVAAQLEQKDQADVGQHDSGQFILDNEMEKEERQTKDAEAHWRKGIRSCSCSACLQLLERSGEVVVGLQTLSWQHFQWTNQGVGTIKDLDTGVDFHFNSTSLKSDVKLGGIVLFRATLFDRFAEEVEIYTGGELAEVTDKVEMEDETSEDQYATEGRIQLEIRDKSRYDDPLGPPKPRPAPGGTMPCGTPARWGSLPSARLASSRCSPGPGIHPAHPLGLTLPPSSLLPRFQRSVREGEEREERREAFPGPEREKGGHRREERVNHQAEREERGHHCAERDLASSWTVGQAERGHRRESHDSGDEDTSGVSDWSVEVEEDFERRSQASSALDRSGTPLSASPDSRPPSPPRGRTRGLFELQGAKLSKRGGEGGTEEGPSHGRPLQEGGPVAPDPRKLTPPLVLSSQDASDLHPSSGHADMVKEVFIGGMQNIKKPMMKQGGKRYPAGPSQVDLSSDEWRENLIDHRAKKLIRDDAKEEIKRRREEARVDRAEKDELKIKKKAEKEDEKRRQANEKDAIKTARTKEKAEKHNEKKRQAEEKEANKAARAQEPKVSPH